MTPFALAVYCTWQEHYANVRTSHKTPLPNVFLGHHPVGGFAEIKSLERSGTLERLIRGEV
jgi:glutaredoxin